MLEYENWQYIFCYADFSNWNKNERICCTRRVKYQYRHITSFCNISDSCYIEMLCMKKERVQELKNLNWQEKKSNIETVTFK